MQLSPEKSSLLFGAYFSITSHLARALIHYFNDKDLKQKLKNGVSVDGISHETLDNFTEMIIPKAATVIGLVGMAIGVLSQSPEIVYSFSIPTITHGTEWFYRHQDSRRGM